jgi:L-fuconolactonase
VAGFRLHPMYYPDEQRLWTEANEPLWEEIASLGAVVQFHLRPGDAEQVSVIAKRCPDTKLILDHMGYPNLDEPLSSYEAITDLSRFDNVYFKLSDVAGTSRQEFPYADVHPSIKQAVDRFGEQRIIWGTGYPGRHRVKNNWPTLAQELKLIREGIPFLSPRQIDRILGETAAEIWNIKA